MSKPPVRIANCSAFLGDRLAAAREMLDGGPIDFLTGDYLAELTMLILWKARAKDASLGYATTFLRQMEDCLGLALERGVKIVANAGGLNPAGLAAELRKLAGRLGVRARIAHLEGDDLLPRLGELQSAGERLEHLDTRRPLAESGVTPVSANAYLGAWGIVAALDAGADVVVCPRVTDASLVVGPAAWHFGWKRDDWDRIAGAVVAGHVIECGPQATGGNYSFFEEVPGLEHPGYPIAEVHEDGSAVITKHPATGGLVSVGTVTAQLLYEIDSPRYANPDAIARFDTIALAEEGPDRVRVSGVRGEPAPERAKVCLNYVGGYRNGMTFVLTGLDLEAKAELVRRTLFGALGGEERFDAVDVRLIRSDKPDAERNEEATAMLRVVVKDRDPRKVGRAFANAAVEMGVANYPGFFCTTPPTAESPFGVYWPCLVPAEALHEEAVLDDGRRLPVAQTATLPEARSSFREVVPPPVALPPAPGGATRSAPLGRLFGARSGDKGGNANVGVWARRPEAYAWLRDFLTIDRFRALVPEARALEVRRYELPNILALNFVVVGLLGEGVAASVRPDPQAKGLGEFLRSRVVDLPASLLESASSGARG
ncbi:MAG TPA: acyclic terpene utilization AtuA family protein [Candidatus Binatia bacterium]|nr:acyclic terpene utilization AtuA family protein [Candidatus Binatia bacterium]